MMTDPLEVAFTAALDADDPDEILRIGQLLDAEDQALRDRLTAPDALGQAALWYAAQGLAVFPCMPGGKRPATRHGLRDASTDPGVIAGWWADTPAANIGLPTGKRFDVLDVDGPVGFRSLADLRDAGRPRVRPIGKVRTASGGRHLYYPAQGSARNRARTLPGLDVRAVGGYVVAPPSRRVDGAMWTWLEPLDLSRLA